MSNVDLLITFKCIVYKMQLQFSNLKLSISFLINVQSLIFDCALAVEIIEWKYIILSNSIDRIRVRLFSDDKEGIKIEIINFSCFSVNFNYCCLTSFLF